jgi:hypothetical protein
MKFGFLVCVALLFMLQGCEGKPKSREASFSEGKRRPSIVIKDSIITVDGKLVWLGESMESWKAAMPGKARCLPSTITAVCVWDDIGVEVGTGVEEKEKSKFINITFSRDTFVGGGFPEHLARDLFQGSLEIDGVVIESGTQFRAVRKAVGSKRELSCGGTDCSSPTGVFSSAAKFYFDLHGTTDQSTILSVSISCTSAASCAALIPKGGKGG